jgi:putative glycosyltransferase (TIGR04348 family)
MKIQLITPAPATARNGNSITALRWRRILKELGHHVILERRYAGGDCDLMIALHARRSSESIERFRELNPDLPLIVTLTGTDLYRDIQTHRSAKRSLELATCLVVLQANGLAELPERLRSKTMVIYQSARRINGQPPGTSNGFKVCVVGHLRPEKDPMRAAMAARRLPASSQIQIIHIGRALTKEMESRARAEQSRNPRYHWIGELPHWKTRRILASSHLLALTSHMEGSSNVLSEAIASSVPVVASKIPGLIGTLGDNYPGYFRVGETRALTRLLQRAESDARFYRQLKFNCARLLPLVAPERERSAWKKLLSEL